MGRKLTTSPDQVLDAAQHVVREQGAAGLTLDAVAARAGISKATVLYSFKSKRALIQALIERCVREDADVNEAAIRALGTQDAAVIHGRLHAAARPYSDDDRATALNLCAAIANEPELRKPMQDVQRGIHRRVAKAEHARGALLAHLALEGVKLLELLDFHRWKPAHRKQILEDIAWLTTQEPSALLTKKKRS